MAKNELLQKDKSPIENTNMNIAIQTHQKAISVIPDTIGINWAVGTSLTNIADVLTIAIASLILFI